MGLSDGFGLQGDIVALDLMGYDEVYFMCGSALGNKCRSSPQAAAAYHLYDSSGILQPGTRTKMINGS